MLRTFWMPLTLLLLGAAPQSPETRVASVFVAEDLINEQLASHVKSDTVKELHIALDPEGKQIFLRGKVHVPVEELRALNLDPTLGAFRFQVALKPETTPQGHLILEFPLNETYFYQASAKDSARDRIVVPTQLLSVALASVRGYLAALSGDFSGFDKRSTRLNATLKGLDRAIAREKDPDALDGLKTQRESLRLQLAAVPIERKQLQAVAKEVAHIMGFTGEKELNLNDELGSRSNALILKLDIAKLAPYLEGVELGGVRVVRDKKDGAGGENFLAVDINSTLAAPVPPRSTAATTPRPALPVPPSLIVRVNQALFESSALVAAEKKSLPPQLRKLDLTFREDGLHVDGTWHATLLLIIPANISFDTIVDFVTTGTDTFEVRMRELKVAGIDVEFLSKLVLETVKKKLDLMLKGACTFEYLGEKDDKSRALKVTVNAAKLVPAFPDMHLVDVDVRESEFLMKIGRVK